MSWFKKILGRDSGSGAAGASQAESPLFAKSDELNEQAESLMAADKPAEALPAINAAIESLQDALGGRTDLKARLNWLGELYSKLAAVKLKLGDMDGAGRAIMESQVFYELAPHPGGTLPLLVRQYPGTAPGGAPAPSAMGRFFIEPPARADGSRNKAVDPAADAGNPFAPADAHDAAADAWMHDGKPAEALGAMKAAIASLKEALVKSPGNPGRERRLAELFGKLASIKFKLADGQGAKEALVESAMAYRGLSARFKEDADLQIQESMAVQKVARIWLAERQPREAMDAVMKAFGIFGRIDRSRVNPETWKVLYNAYTELGAECLSGMGRQKEADEMRSRLLS